MAKRTTTHLPNGGDIPVRRVRNVQEFVRRFGNGRRDYKQLFQKRIEEIRTKYARKSTEKVSPEVDDSLEYHLREYLINALLSALNWRLGSSPEDGLPNLVPEAPLRSSAKDTVCFLDYFGVEGADNKPLLMVETKRPKSPLPERQQATGESAQESLAEVVCAGLSGTDLKYDWNKWLETLRDYIKSTKDRSGEVPRRVVTTNGDWLILFADSEDSFLSTSSPTPAKVFVYEIRDHIEQRADELFGLLEYHSVLGKIPALRLGEVAFHIRPDQVDSAMHGLRLMYIEEPDSSMYCPS